MLFLAMGIGQWRKWPKDDVAPELSVPLIAYPPGREPPPCPPSGLGVRVVGVDLARLEYRRESHGIVEGHATLIGTWHEPLLVVQEQRPVQREAPHPGWTQVPCPAPAGGWPHGDPPPANLSEKEQAALAITSVTVFQPSPSQTVTVIAAERPDEVRQALESRYAGRLCVVRSRWTGQRIRAVWHRVSNAMEEWLIYECGHTSTPDGQALLTAEVARVLATFAHWVATVPDGLLHVTPWLAPDVPRKHQPR